MDLVLLATFNRSAAMIRGCMPDHVCCVVLESAKSIRQALERYRPCGIIINYDDAFAKELSPATFVELVSRTQPLHCPILLYSADSEFNRKLRASGFSVTTRPDCDVLECRAIVKEWQKRFRAG